MSEAELLDVARSTGDHVAGYFGQLITITFAMVVAVYYFLHQAKLPMKIFAFLVYSMGMAMYFALMVGESNVALGAIEGLKALPDATISRPTAHLLAVEQSWLHTATLVLVNGAFLILWLGVFFLLFFWKRPRSAPHEH